MEIVSTLMVTRGQRIDGGQGQNSLGVFEATDTQLGQSVALKEIAKAGRNVTAFFSEAQRMFNSEHPNVVPILRASQTNDSILLLMPLYQRGSLKTRLAQGPVSISEAITLGRQILGGAGAIHAGGSVHLDIKPSNVLIGDNGVAKIADFGQARELGPDGFAILPDRMYATITPPEAFSQRSVDRLADIFQIGVTLYQAVNGEQHTDAQLSGMDRLGLRQAIAKGKFPNRNAFLPHVPDRLVRAIRKAMCVEPAKRFQSAAEFANALTKVQSLDWSVSIQSDGTTQWEALRRNHPTLRWIKKPDGKNFKAEFYTVKNGKPRATKRALWKCGMKPKEADAYFSLLFAALAP